MNRRTAISRISSGIAVGSIGCLSVAFEESDPVDFILLNFTESAQVVEVSIRDGDRVLLENSYEMEVGTRVEPDEIKESGFTEASNGEVFDVTVSLASGEMEEREFRVECIEQETPDEFIAEIREYGERDYTYFEFQQSICTSGR
ncbi:hypothetical protein [Natronorubrum halophilum]|uniref:hypothetical protein n=1 Tax=Natronorubrum halophilum TaxID=1702106 RepID=UPI0010C1A863|nr:hypothetical protein [Natronorubrum halophilum]